MVEPLPVEEEKTLDKPFWQLHPLLEDYEKIEQDKNLIFPYKWIVYGGNYWSTLAKVVKPRGFTLVKAKNDDKLDNIQFIWRPGQFSRKVK